MKVAVVTLFPELFDSFVETSFIKRARQTGVLEVVMEPLREHGLGNHRSVDDTPYGGGSGMLLRVDCVVAAVEHAEQRLGGRCRRVLLTPQGRRFDQAAARGLADRTSLVLVCGRYEGFDDRVRQFVDEEVSIGDFVLTGGEIPAMAVLEAAVRYLPGVLGNEASTEEESFSCGDGHLLEYPHFTRPAEFRGLAVPDVLKSGDHGRIAEFRAQQARERTRQRRPDLVSADDEEAS